MKLIFLSLVLTIASASLFSQHTATTSSGVPPTPGQPMPFFSLNKITHYKSASATLDDFKGKWLVLDLWSTNCISCIKSFPKMSALQKRFKGQVQWIMVGENSKVNGEPEALYERLRVKQNLDLVVAYDSMLFHAWKVDKVPYIVIVNPTGIVEYLTFGGNMTAEKIQEMIEGKHVSFVLPESLGKVFDWSDTTAAISQSIVSYWNGEGARHNEVNVFSNWPREHLQKLKEFKIVKSPLASLYNNAYFGSPNWGPGDSLYAKVCPKPIYDLKDATPFMFDTLNQNGSGYYNYMLRIPIESVERKRMMKIMQNDLEKAFPYVVAIECRPLPVWKLVSIGDNTALRTKGGEPFISNGSIAGGFTAKNQSIPKLLRRITMYVESLVIPFVDETGISNNIDITMDADMTNIKTINEELKKFGLAFVKGTKVMRVLVIRDPGEIVFK